MPWYEATIDWLTKRVPWEVMFGLCVATGALLFFGKALGIEESVRPYRFLVITFFIFSAAVLFAGVATLISGPICMHFRNWASRRHSRAHLHQLNPLEKQVCKQFVTTDGEPIGDNPANGHIASLVEGGIIWQVRTENVVGGWLRHFNIHPWALRYLKEHPELLEGARER